MVSFITHIVLSDKVFESNFSDKNLSDFILGTSFPDIRYLKVVEREKTHIQEISLETAQQEPNSFLSGLKFHSLIDIAREKYVTNNHIYSLLPESKWITQSLKFYEDVVLYSKVNDWATYAQFFSNTTQEESDFGISESDIQKWHNLIQGYIGQPPTHETIQKLVTSVGFSAEITTEILSNMNKMRSIPGLHTKIIEFYDNLETLIQPSR